MMQQTKKRKKWYILGILFLVFTVRSWLFGNYDDIPYYLYQAEPRPLSITLLRFLVENDSKLMTLFDEDGDDLYYDDDGYISLSVKNNKISSWIHKDTNEKGGLSFAIIEDGKRKFYEINNNNQIKYYSINGKEIFINEKTYQDFKLDFQKFYQPVYEKSKFYAMKNQRDSLSQWILKQLYKPRK